MRHTVHVDSFADWRREARLCLQRQLRPESLIWCDGTAPQLDLLSVAAQALPPPVNAPVFNVPAAFLQLANKVACHRDSAKWELLYLALWRLAAGERYLLSVATDPLVHRLQTMAHQVSRDAHKTKAFVRFREVGQENGRECFVAWHCPDHKVLPLVAPFFQRRFGVMNWAILTPQQSAYWDGQDISFGPGTTKDAAPSGDSMEEAWRVFYRAIFNPARIKLKMMRQEMPVRYWKTMPETEIITDMLREAPARVAEMLRHQEGFAKSAADFIPAARDYAALKTAAQACEGCPLHCNAQQTVFGVGPIDAPLMIVGEQPGFEEDREGTPFVGPAGQVLQQAMGDIGLPRARVYLTNAVKHFKFVLKNDRPMHQTPNAREINACKPWLTAEREMVKPRIILGLGLTAAKSLLGHGFAMKDNRGRWFDQDDGSRVIITYHPSAILRAATPQQGAEFYAHLRADMIQAAEAAQLLVTA